MIKVKGIYDGTNVRLLEPVNLKPDTPVEVLIPEQASETEQEQAFLQRLVNKGLLVNAPPVKKGKPFKPISIRGEALSQTIIKERR